MNHAGALLDTGPLVALLSRTDANHERAKTLFRSYAPPFRTCEAVLVETSHLLSKDDPAGPADIVRLGAAGLFEVVLRVNEHWAAIERSEEHTSELQSHSELVCRLLLEKKKYTRQT